MKTNLMQTYVQMTWSFIITVMNYKIFNISNHIRYSNNFKGNDYVLQLISLKEY